MRTNPWASGLLLSVGILTGCAVGPDYRSPEIDVSSRFLGQEAIVHRDVQSKADLTAWWAGFDDPLLTRFISLALEQNLDIAQAAARVAQSRASLRLADAALLPSADVRANAARTYQSVETPLGQLLNATPDFDRNGSFYEANLAASWEIDVFGGLRRGREAARAEFEASEAGAIATRLAVAAQTADVYVTIRGLQARIAIARQQTETRRELVSTVKLQFEKGIAAELQMRQVEGSLAQVEAQIPVLESGLDAAMNALDVLLAVQHVQRIHRSIEPGFEDGDLRLDLSQRTLDLAHLQLSGDPLFELKLDRGEKLTARLRLLSGDRYARLQAADRNVHICRLRGHSQPCRNRAGFGCVVLRARSFLPSTQPAEHVDLPTCIEVGLVVAAIAIEVAGGAEQLSEWRFKRLVGSCSIRVRIDRRKQCC